MMKFIVTASTKAKINNNKTNRSGLCLLNKADFSNLRLHMYTFRLSVSKALAKVGASDCKTVETLFEPLTQAISNH